jgi:serine/threonine-protein kinase
MIAKHMQSAPIPPSQRIGKPVSPELERLILKCLAKDPMDRPQSAALLAQALEFVPSDGWSEDHARRWWEKNSRPAIAPGAAVLPQSLGPVVAT